MIRLRHHYARSIAAALVLLVVGAVAHAETPAPGTSLQELLARYQAAYQPPTDLEDAAWQVEALGRQLEHRHLPRLSFTERATWSNFQRWTLELDLSVTLPLYRSNSAILNLLQDQRLRALGLDQNLARHEALSYFKLGLLEVSLLRSVEEQVSGALQRLYLSGWHRPASLDIAVALDPAERDLLVLQQGAESLLAYVTRRLTELEAELFVPLGLTASALESPPYSQLLPQVVPELPPLERCLVSSPLLAQAEMHHDLQDLEHQALRAPDLSLELLGGGAYQRGALQGTIGLEMRLPIPNGYPVAGQLGVSTDLGGTQQTMQVSWPPPPALNRPRSALERVKAKESELESIAADIRAIYDNAESAADRVAATELQLLWLVADANGLRAAPGAAFSAAELAAVHALADSPTGDPLTDLQRVRHWSDTAFARLAHAEQLLALGLVCGAGA
ncbi:MAG: hypothetical protein WDA03_04825 [Trueperaceae bacterium]